MKYEEIGPYLTGAYSKLKYFVETGTYKAVTTLMAAKHFEHVYTTEIVPRLHEEAKQRVGASNITFLLGDSVELLKTITPKVKEGAVFFLDAHQSGPDTSNNGKQHVPLLQELDVILQSQVGPSLYILDDLRLFDKFWDWKGITPTSIIQKFKDAGATVDAHFAENDRYYVFAK